MTFILLAFNLVIDILLVLSLRKELESKNSDEFRNWTQTKRMLKRRERKNKPPKITQTKWSSIKLSCYAFCRVPELAYVIHLFFIDLSPPSQWYLGTIFLRLKFVFPFHCALTWQTLFSFFLHNLVLRLAFTFYLNSISNWERAAKIIWKPSSKPTQKKLKLVSSVLVFSLHNQSLTMRSTAIMLFSCLDWPAFTTLLTTTAVDLIDTTGLRRFYCIYGLINTKKNDQ